MKKVLTVLLLVLSVSIMAEEELQPEPTHVIVSIPDINLVLQYLGTRPYAEVAEVIARLQTAQLVNVQPTDSEEE